MNQRLSSVNWSCQESDSDLCITKWPYPPFQSRMNDFLDDNLRHPLPQAMQKVLQHLNLERHAHP